MYPLILVALEILPKLLFTEIKSLIYKIYRVYLLQKVYSNNDLKDTNNSLKLKTISVNNVYYANGISYYKYDAIGNKKVKVEALINQTLPANAEYPINTIPSNLKPDIGIQFVVITTLGNSCTVVLKPDGILYLKPNVNLTADEGIYTDFLDFVI